jgi:hypothetical protein
MMVRKLAVIVALVACVAATPATAANISYTNGGTAFTTAALTGFQTHGHDMGGMVVTAIVLGPNGGPTTLSGTWADLGGGEWGVNFGGTDFDLTLGADTDTYDGQWMFDFFPVVGAAGFKLESLAFNGASGRTVFDRTEPDMGTDGSFRGWDMQGFGGYQGDIRVDYRNPVGVGGNAPVGDIYSNVVFNFLSNGGLSMGEYSFVMDADNGTTDIIPDNPVPEPTSMVLLGTGLLGLVRASRKRTTK